MLCALGLELHQLVFVVASIALTCSFMFCSHSTSPSIMKCGNLCISLDVANRQTMQLTGHITEICHVKCKPGSNNA